MRVDVARVDVALRANKRQQQRGAPECGGRTRHASRTRMHQRLDAGADEAVVDEEVLFDRERSVAPLEVAGAVVPNAVPQRQILGAGGRANRIGLHEAESLDGTTERGRRTQAARYSQAPEVVEGHPRQRRRLIALAA